MAPASVIDSDILSSSHDLNVFVIPQIVTDDKLYISMSIIREVYLHKNASPGRTKVSYVIQRYYR